MMTLKRTITLPAVTSDPPRLVSSAVGRLTRLTTTARTRLFCSQHLHPQKSPCGSVWPSCPGNLHSAAGNYPGLIRQQSAEVGVNDSERNARLASSQASPSLAQGVLGCNGQRYWVGGMRSICWTVMTVIVNGWILSFLAASKNT